jgi:hypothetical protein
MLADGSMVVLVVGMFFVLARWISRGPPGWRVASIGALAAWLILTAWLATTGVLSDWAARPPRLPLVVAGALALGLVLQRTAAFRALLGSTSIYWPIGLQIFRFAVETILFALHRTGRAPVQVTFEGRNFDILVGLTAPIVAWSVARGRASPWLVVGWNALGLGVLVNTMAVVATSTPGPLFLWPGAPFTELMRWPLVWLPAFLAPLAVMLHVASLQQTVSLLRSSTQRTQS